MSASDSGGKLDHGETVATRRVTIELINGKTVTGDINIGRKEIKGARTSDYLRKFDERVLVLYNVGQDRKGKPIFVNFDNIATITPLD